MTTVELKEKMMKLWKNTFHDSDAYVSLIFDNYFNPDFIEYHEEGNQLVSALLGIPYEFSNGKSKMKALYLCGLATASEYRHRGIMNDLLEKINKKAKDNDYIFTFLIPANDSLINYYSIRKYEAAIYRVEDRYTELHNFDKDYRSNIECEDERIFTLKSKLFDSLRVEIFDINDTENLHLLIKLICNFENKISTYTSLLHSPKDIELVIRENVISNGKIFVAYNKDNALCGVAFINLDDRRRVHIPKVYYEDQGSLYRLLDAIKKKYSESPISLYYYPEECDRKALWEKVYGASNPDGAMLGGAYGISERVYNVGNHAKPYGMIRILNLREILKFIAIDRSDSKFSILVKLDSNDGKVLKCDIIDGKAAFQIVDYEKIKCQLKNINTTVLKEREVIEIIFRKKGSSNMIQEAFGIPRLPINMALLLD